MTTHPSHCPTLFPSSSPSHLSRPLHLAARGRAPLPTSLPLPFLLLLLTFLSLLPQPTLSIVPAVPLYLSFTLVALSPPSNSTSPISPPARCDHLLTPSSTFSSFHLFGGRGGSSSSIPILYNDVWTFTPTSSLTPTGQWSQPSTPLAPLSPRYAHAGSLLVSTPTGGGSGVVRDLIYVYGGVGSDGSYLDDVWTVSTSAAGVDAEWSQVRALSTSRVVGGLEASPPQVTQPSARGWTTMDPITFPATLLLQLNHSGLGSPNLLTYLATASGAAGPLTGYALYGGRSDPDSPYATTWTAGPVSSSGSVTDASVLNADYSDLWMYLPNADVWFSIGNLTCVNRSLVCLDAINFNQLADNVSSNYLTWLISNLTALTTLPARPEALSPIVLQMDGYVAALNDSLEETLSYILASPPTLTMNQPNACSQQCLQLTEPSPPPVYASSSCPIGSNMPGCLFYNPIITSQQVSVSQLRPNLSEGYASASFIGASGYSVKFQFGGFSCAGKHPGGDPFTFTDYDAACFSQTLYVLDTTTIDMVWWAIQPPPQSSGSNQFLLWPSARAWSTMAVDTVNQWLWLYGGAVQSGGKWRYYSDLYIFDILNVEWLPYNLVGYAPAATRSSSLFLNPAPPLNHPYIFGGCLNPSLVNDVYSSSTYAIQTNLDLTYSNWIFSGQATSSATAGSPTAFLAYAVDNSVSRRTLSFAQGLAGQFRFTWAVYDATGDVINTSPSVPTGNDLGNGQYAFNFTIQEARTAQLTVFYKNPSPNPTESIIGNPLIILVQPAAYSPHASTLLYSNYSTVAKNQLSTLTVQLRDTWGNIQLASVGTVLLSLTYTPSSVPNATASMTHLPSSTFDNGDGTYNVQYLAPDVSYYNLYVWVNNVGIQGSPVLVNALDPLQIPPSIQQAFLALSVLFGAVVLAVMLVLLLLRRKPAVRAGSPLFLELIGVGMLMCIASVPVYAYPSPTTCRLFPFLLTTGYILTLSSLFARLYRIRAVYTGASTAQRLTDLTMLAPVLALLLMETLLNLVWLIADPLTLVTFDADTVLPYHQCSGPHAVPFIATSVAFNLLVAAYTTYLALRLRNVSDPTNDTKLMGAALYNLVLILVIAISLTWTASNTQTSHEDFLIPASAILWCCMVTAATSMAPKLYYAVRPPPGNLESEVGKGMAGTGGGAGGGGEGGVSGGGGKRRSFEAAGMTAEERAERKRRRAREGRGQWRGQGPNSQPQPTPSSAHNSEDGVELGPVPQPPLRSLAQMEEGSEQLGSSAHLTSAPPSEDPPIAFNGDRRNSFSSRARPAPITTVGATLVLSPPPVRGGSKSRSRGGTSGGGGGGTGRVGGARERSGGSGRIGEGVGASGGVGVGVHSPPVARGGRASPSSGSPQHSGGSQGKRGGGGSAKGSGKGSRGSGVGMSVSASHDHLSEQREELSAMFAEKLTEGPD